jgi:PAS domain S-box-containing protein
LLLGDEQMSNEPEIGKEMSKEEKLAGISDTSQNKVQIEQIAKDSSGTALGVPSNISGNNMEILENTQNSNNGKNTEPSKDLSEKYRLIAHHTSDLIAFTTFDVNPIFTFVSPSHLKILGFEAEELLGKSWFDFIHQDDKQQIRTILIKHIDAKINGILTVDMVEEAQKLDFRILDKSGHWHFLQSTINIVNDELLFISKDITEQKHAVETLHQSEEMFSKAFRLSPESITLTSLKEGRYVDVNESFLHVIGYSRDEVIGRTATELNIWVDPNDRARFIQGLKEHGSIRNLECRMRKKSDEVGTVLMSSEIITINGEPCALTVTTNITDHKRIEDTLQENEQRMKFIIQGLSIAAFVIGSDHRVLYWNKALEALSNIRAEEIIGSTNHWKAFYTQKRPCMADILIDGGLDDMEKWYAGRYKKSSLLDESFEATDFFPNLGNNGKWLRFTATVIRNTNGDLVDVLETLEDISKHKKAEETLRESEERFRLIISGITDILYEWNIKTGSMQWFGDIDSRLGYENGTFPRTLEAFLKHVHPEDVNNVQAVATNGLKSHQKWQGEYRVINKDGADLYWYGTGIGIYDQEGNPIKVVGAVTDVTERKRAELLEHALYEIARAPETKKSLNDLYHAVHLIIKGLMPTENFYVALYDEKENLLHYPYFVDEIDVWPQPEKPGKGLTAYVLRTGHTLLCDAALDEELIHRGEVEMVGSPSACWLGAPLKVGEKIIGIIALQHYSDSKAYGEREKHVLDFVSGQIANTIERKRTEEALKKSEEKFVKAFNSSPIAICITRISDGKFIEVNESVEKLSGYSRMELLTESTIGLNLWADSEDRKQVMEQLAKTGSVHDHEYRFRIKSGNEIVVRYSAEVIGFNDERCCLSVLVDITEQKKMEVSLRESEEKYRSIVENTQDVIMLTGPDSRVSYMSPACVSVLGYNPDELVGKIPEIFYPDDIEKVHTALSSTLQGGNGSNLEHRILTKNGKMRWVSHSWSPILTENHELKCIVSIVRDITESKIAEQTLKEKIEELEKYKNVTVNREVKMVALKNEINELCKQLNQKPKYPNI